MPDINFVVKNGLTVNGSFTANSTVVNAAAIASTSLTAGANVTVNTTTMFVGTATVNTTTTAGSMLLANSIANTSITPGLITLNLGAFRANSSAVVAGAVIASSVNATSVNAATANATTSIVVGDNVAINTASFFVSNTLGNTTTTAGLIVINGGAFRANSTVVNAAAIIALSVNATSVNAATANATTSIVVGSNVTVNTGTLFIGNATVNSVTNSTSSSIRDGLFSTSITALSGIDISLSGTGNSRMTSGGFTVGANVDLNNTRLLVGNASVNTNITAGQISISGVTVNSTIYAGTANNANNLGGQAPSYYTNITDRLGYTPVQQGGGAGQLTNKVYIGWTGSSQLALQVDATNFGSTWPLTANNANNLGGQAPSYYTDITSRLGYTPANKAGDTFTGEINIGGGTAGQKVLRFVNNARNVVYYLNPDGSSGLYDTTSSTSRFVTDTSGNISVPSGVICNTVSVATGGVVTTGRVYSLSPRGYTVSGGTTYTEQGFSMTTSQTRFGNWIWDDTSGIVSFSIDGNPKGFYVFDSDISLKKDIEPTTYDATKTINDIEFVSYNWKPTQYTDKDGVSQTVDRGHVDCGFVAQQLQTVDPGLVKALSDGKLIPDMLNLTSVMGLALQNAQKKIEELEARIQNLEAN